MKYCTKKEKFIMVIRTIGLIALGLLVSSITPIVYGPLAIIAAPWAIGVCIWSAIELNRNTISEAKSRHDKVIDGVMEQLESIGLANNDKGELA